MNDTIEHAAPSGKAFSRFRLLVWTSFVLGIAGMLATPEAAMVRSMGSTISAIVLAVLVVMYGTSAWVNLQLIKGKNWARIAYAAGVVLWVAMLAGRSDYGALETVLTIAELAVDVTLVVMMFTNPVKALFAGAGRPAQAAGG
ncbi:MAG TPA: hypothetical protein VF774_28840 [Pseudoduganella sp.]|jgi:hypothetical protein